MGNPELDDISVLTTLQRLVTLDALADTDKEALLEHLQSDWGKRAGAQIVDPRVELDEDVRATLRRYSIAFRDRQSVMPA
jgi:hypothetical protein